MKNSSEEVGGKQRGIERRRAIESRSGAAQRTIPLRGTVKKTGLESSTWRVAPVEDALQAQALQRPP